MASPLSFRALLLAALFAAFTSASTQRSSKPGQAPPQLTQQQISDIRAYAKAEIKRTVSPEQISAWKRMSNNLQRSRSPQPAAQKIAFLNQPQDQPLNLGASVGGAICAICTSVMYVAVGAWFGEIGCDAACAGAAEAIGLGPEDPLADLVAGSCLPLCAAAKTPTGKAAGSGGGAYFACHSVYPVC